MLGQGRDGARSTNQFAVAQQNRNASPQVSSVNGGSIGSARGMSDGSIVLDESEKARPKMRGKGKRNPSPANGQRRADEPPTRAPPK
ncbi:hypothetical protein FOPG_19320 [Fusarium oxysporum f. sp. conglutinans race 2 54008]|uniref:Uncharacterized protein n=1 Tax=Fusarium oxysporum f. sp. conglutinans race 2 54008 TaxID=1089457 RepID=X0HTC2_FUSOX|nr:hypothetical protein FOPG_19320 [Fusarium oxysporum f. sp. conglutinans race 2 54008]